MLLQLQDLYQPQRRNVHLAPVQTGLIKGWESIAGPDSQVVANNLYHLAVTREQTGQLEEADQAIQRAIAILEKTYGSDAPPVGFALICLASIENKLGKDDLAKELLNRESAIRQKTTFQDVLKVGRGVTAPRMISHDEPKYSDKARKNKIQGAVVLSLVVDTNGEPSDLTVLLPLGDGLDENAVKAVRTWRFQPGTKDGRPVRVQATINVSFRLL